MDMVKRDEVAKGFWANGNVQLFERLLGSLAFLTVRLRRIEYGDKGLGASAGDGDEVPCN